MFVFLSFHSGLLATVLFFRKKYSETEEEAPSHQRKASINIELVETKDLTLTID